MSARPLDLLGYVAAELGRGSLDLGDQRLATIDQGDDVTEVGAAEEVTPSAL
jgi:hypothetical protein